jgi:hypothetical protein
MQYHGFLAIEAQKEMLSIRAQKRHIMYGEIYVG